jgi:hypothetical protein
VALRDDETGKRAGEDENRRPAEERPSPSAARLASVEYLLVGHEAAYKIGSGR